MNTNKKAIMALVMVLVMLAVPLTAIEQSEESDAGTVAPTPSHYAYKVTYTTTEGASQSQIGTVTNLVTSTAMTAATTSSQGDWKWSTTTGLGPFNMFYAAISTGQTDSGALSEKAGHVAYILDPSDLTKAVKGKSISTSTSISSVISKYNIMLVIPTVYWYSDAAGNLYIADQADSSYLPDDTVRANMKAYAHQVDNATVYPYLAIGVYEAYWDETETYGLMSATGKAPKASTTLPVFRSYTEKSNDLITDECGTYTLWNFYEWTLYKILAQTAIGGKNAQSLIGSGNSSGSGSTTTGLSNAGGPYAAGGSGNSAYAKVFIENAWGSVWEFVDNTYLKNGALYAGSALSNSLSADNPVVSGAEYVPTTTRLSVPASMSQHDIYRQSLDSATWDMPIPLSSGIYPKNTTNPTGASGDSIWTNNGQNSCLFVGGHWNNGASAGLSAWLSSLVLSNSGTSLGARLAYMMTADAAGTGSDYTVSFEETQSSRTTSTKVSPGDSVLLPTVKPVTGYDFAGWYSDSQCTQEYIGPAGSYFKPVGSTTLYSKFVESDDYYTIHVSKGEAGSTADYDMYVKKGESMVLPAAADITGYTFSGWYTGASAGTFTVLVGIAGQYYTPSADIYLSPKYTQLTSATITFNANSSTVQAISSYNGKTITLPDAPGVADKLFVGWYSNSELTTFAGYAGAPYSVAGTATLYAKYVDATEYWTVTIYSGDSGTASAYTVKVPKGTSMVLPQADPIATKTFAGWSSVSGRTSVDIGIAGEYYTPAANSGLYPKYDAVTSYTITVNKGNAGSTTDYTFAITAGESIQLPEAAEILGYEFNGWYLTSTSEGTRLGLPGASYTPTGSITLLPKYIAVTTYTISIYQLTAAPSTYSTHKDITINSGQMINLPLAPEVDGYAFVGWYTAKTSGTYVGLSGASYKPGATGDLYPIYQAISNYTITMYQLTSAPSTYGTSKTITINPGEIINLPLAPEVDGYKFTGWYTAKTSGTYVGLSGASYKPEATGDLYPIYEAVSTWTVTYKVWNGSGSTTGDYEDGDTRKVVQGESITLPNAKYFANYQLNYWATYSSGFTQVGTYGQQYTPEDNVTLYPIYGPLESGLTYSVTIMDTANGTSYTPGDVVKVQQGSSIRLPSAPTIAGKVFDHWSTYTTSVQSDNLGITGQFYQPGDNVKIAPVYADTVTVTVYKLDDPGKASPAYTVDHTLEVKSGVKFPLPDVAVKIGYVPTGWATSSGSTTSVGATGEYYSVTSATSLYPIYSASATSAYWTVTLYDHNDAELTGKGAIVTQGYPLTLPAGPAVENKTFSGWATRFGSSPNYEYTVIGQPGEFYTPSGNLDLYARYTDVHTQALADLAYTKDGSASTASGVESYLTASLSSQTIVGDGFVYLVVNKVSLCDYTVSVSGSGVYVVPLVDGLYRLYSAANAECTVTVNVNTQIAQGYKAFYVSGIANQGKSVQINMNAASDAGLVGGTMDIGGVYCRYDGSTSTWIYGSIENVGSVAPQTVTAGSASFSGTFTLPSGYSVYYVYGIYNPTDGDVQYSGGQIGPAMPALESSS